MDFQNLLCPLVIRNNYDVRFFSDADLVADRVYTFLLLVSIEGDCVIHLKKCLEINKISNMKFGDKCLSSFEV